MKKLTLNPEDFSGVNPNAGYPKQIFTDISSPGGFAAALDKVIIIMLFLAALLAFIALLYGSIQYLLAAGDKKSGDCKKQFYILLSASCKVLSMSFLCLFMREPLANKGHYETVGNY